ncbi:MAG: hypothetical protein HY068_01380 [Burkholderiales bacterium]|nr:hypothetical protein [Burkholderiales bacterium]
MKYPTLLVLAVLAWPALSLAQNAPDQTRTPPAAADAGESVPALRYHSVLVYSPRGVVQDQDDWAAANARVGQFARGHADILKAEQAQGLVTPATPNASAPGAKP